MAKRRRSRKVKNVIKKYNSLVRTSSAIWFVAGAFVLGFGIYFREIFELVFGVFAMVYGLANLKNQNYSEASIKRIEMNKLSFILVFIIVYSLVNPIGNIPLLFDLYKRDMVLNGGLVDD